jgi:hypothetical protein
MTRKQWNIIDTANNIVAVIKANSESEALDLWRSRHPGYTSQLVRAESADRREQK